MSSIGREGFGGGVLGALWVMLATWRKSRSRWMHEGQCVYVRYGISWEWPVWELVEKLAWE